MGIVFILTMGMFALGLDAYVFAALLPGIGTSFHVTVSEAGLVVTGFTVSYGLLSPLIAAASASLDRRIILIGSLLLFGLANIGSMLAPTFGTLVLTRIVAGAAAGSYAPSAAATAVRLVPDKRRGRALAVVLGGLTIATTLGVPIGVFIATHFGWRAALLLVTSISGVAVVGIVMGVPSVQAPSPGLGERFALLVNRSVLFRIIIMLLATTASLGLYTYLATVLAHFDITRNVWPEYFLLWGIAGALGNGMTGWLLDKGISSARVLTVCLAVMMITMSLFPLIGQMQAGIIVLLLVWGATTWSLQVPLQHQLMHIVPENVATAMALLASSVYLGGAIGSVLGALVVKASPGLLGPMAAFVVFWALFFHLKTSSKK